MSDSRPVAAMQPVDPIETLHDPAALAACAPQADQVPGSPNNKNCGARIGSHFPLDGNPSALQLYSQAPLESRRSGHSCKARGKRDGELAQSFLTEGILKATGPTTPVGGVINVTAGLLHPS